MTGAGRTDPGRTGSGRTDPGRTGPARTGAAARADRDALRQGLSRLAASRPLAAEGRRLRGFGRRTRLGALLDEIDATVLPQRLVLTDAGGREWHLDAAGRRLTRIGRADATGPGVSLDALEEADLRTLGAALRAALEGPAAPLLRPEGLSAAGRQGGRGRGVAALRALWDEPGPAAPDAAPEAVVTEAVDAFGAGVRAWITGTDDGVEGGGEDPWLGSLEDTVLALGLADRDGPGAAAPPLGRDAVLALPGQEGAAAIVTTLGGGFAALTVDAEVADTLAGQLQARLHGWA